MNVLLTGMSGTGKSTLVAALAARGYRAVDADDPGLSEYRTPPPGPGETPGEPEWMWCEDRIVDLLSEDVPGALFLAGCASNQVKFYERFDHIVLLTAPLPVMLERLASRTTNAFGKRPGELERILRDREAVEPLLRRVATRELDTTAPLDELVAAVLALAGHAPSRA